MSFFRITCCILLFFGMATTMLRATHIVGGEMTYRCLGNNRYEISVTVFRDCDTGVPWFDNPASVGVFDSSGALVSDIRIALRGNDTLDLDLTDSCYVAPPNVCIHRTTYRDTVTLPFLAGGYTLAYQRCCRNQDIVNIVDPLGTGATYTIRLTEAAMLQCNNSPTFRDWPPVYLCVDVPIVFDHSAVDADGDSLVYEMCAPYEGATPFNPQPQPPFSPPYDSVQWLTGAGYSTNNMLGGVDALRIDPRTGLLTGTPTRFGVFVVGIRVREYRNGQLISVVQRDFQYAVGQCGRRNNAAFFAPELICDNDLAVAFTNGSQTSIQQFQWDFGDQTTTADQSTLYSPAYIYPDTGRYTVRLIVAPNTVCSDTFYRDVNVQRRSLFAGFSFSVPSCSDTALVQFTDRSIDTIVSLQSWQWTFSNGDTSTLQNPTSTFFVGGTYTIRQIVTATNGCRDTVEQSFTINLPTLTIPSIVGICPNNTGVSLNPSGNPTYQYQWSPATYLNAANIANPFASPPDSVTPFVYALTVTVPHNYGGACVYERNVTVDHSPPFTVDIEADSVTCAAAIQLTANATVPVTVGWSTSASFDSVFSVLNPTVANLTSSNQTFYVQARDALGCIQVDSLPITSGQFAVQATFTHTRIQCGNPTQIQFFDTTTDTSQGAIINRLWTIQDGINPPITSTAANPLINFTIGGTYLVRLQVNTSSSCTGITEEIITVLVPSITSPDSVGICPGSASVVLNPNGNPAYQYQWSPATNLSSVTAVSPSTNTSTTRTYFVTVTAISGTDTCIVFDSVRVVRPPALTVDVPNTQTYCGGTVTLTATPNRPVQSYQWSGDPSFFTILATGNPVTVAPTVFPFSGYYVRATDFYGCTATDFAIVQQINQPVNVQFGYAVQTCTDTLRVQFTDLTTDTVGTRVVSRQWTVSNGQSSTQRNPLFVFTQTGTYTVTLTVTLANGCTGTLTQNIQFNVPRLQTSATARICAGASSVVLNAGASSTMTYAWSPATGLSSTSAPSPTATPPSLPFVYTVTITGQNNIDVCSRVHTITVDAAPPIVIDLPPDTVVCSEPYQLIAQTQNSVLLEWALVPDFNPVVLFNANPVFVSFDNLPSSLWVYARVRDINGCLATDSILITRIVDTIPVDFAYDVLGCGANFDVQFTDLTQHPHPIYSQIWNFGNGQTSNAPNPTTQYTQSGTYFATLTMTDARGCIGSRRDTLQFDLPQTTSPDSIALCSPASLYLNPNGNPRLQYQWSPAALLDNPNAVSPLANVQQNTTFTVTITAVNEGDTCTEIQHISISTGNLQLNAMPDANVCSNRITLQASSASATQYYWSLNNAMTQIIGTGSPFISNLNGSRWFYVLGEDAFGCRAIDSVYVTLGGSTIAPDFDITRLACGDSLRLAFTDRTDTLDQQPIYWQWTFGDGDTSYLQTPTHAYTQSGNYSVELFVRTANGCDALISRPISVELQTRPAIADTLRVCAGQSIAINPNGDPTDRYFWSTAQTGLNSYSIANPSATPAATTTYFAQILSINLLNGQADSCYTTLQTTVAVQPLPSANIAGDTSLCNADSLVNLQASSNAANAQYTWSDNRNFSTTLTTTPSLQTNAQASSTWFYLRVRDALGCESTDSAQVRRTSVSIALDDQFFTCPNVSSADFQAIGASAGYAYEWQPSSALLSGQNTPNATFALPLDSLTIQLVASQNGCTDTATASLVVLQSQPPLDIFAAEDTINAGDTLQLLATFDANYSYTWQNDPALSSLNTHNPTINPTTSGTFYLTITDANGCANADSIRIALRQSLCGEPFIFVPNAFSPDGDGLNERLFVRGINLTEVYFAVYNRWGELVFETNDQARGWDGTYKNATLAPDVYGYYLRCRCADGQEFFKKGNVTLLR